MKVVLFAAGGEIPLCALTALQGVADVTALVRPGPLRGLVPTLRRLARRVVRGPSSPDELSQRASAAGIPERRTAGRTDPTLAPWLRERGIDMVCVATFPWRIRDDVLAAPRLGAVNLHASLLPRHRGPNPWFWVYHADDRDAGVTVHECAPAIDSGGVLAQTAWPLARGYPVRALHRDVAERGAELLAGVVAAADGAAPRAVPQDESRATRAPRLQPGASMVDNTWPVERVWHLLAGTAGQFREPLLCAGRPVLYDRAPGFDTCDPRAAAGTVESAGADGTWRLWCRDGFVRLESGAP